MRTTNVVVTVATTLMLVATPVVAGPAAVGVDDVTTAPGDVPSAAGSPTVPGTAPGPSSGSPVVTDLPPDPEDDRLGWEPVNGTGLWYNESITVDRSNGLNATELDRVVARAMARVEKVRKLEFEKPVPVDVISRATYRNNTARRFANVTPKDRLHQNVKWEAMLMVNESTDAIAVQQSNTGSTVGGYYSPSEDRIVIVSENQTSPKIDEITLSQELFHALQDQRFNITRFNQSTQELHNAIDGLIEGDANLVDRLYQKRCENEWNCLLPESSSGGGGGSVDIHFGLYLVTYQPYSDGPKFVQRIYQRKGWDAINDLYENPPASTEQVIHPEKYGEDRPANMTFTDRSGEEWRVLELPNGSIDYATFGEAGLATMLFYPYYPSNGRASPVVGPRDFFNLTPGGGVSSFDPVNYGTKFTSGWDGDRLYPYVTNDSMETNETGYVWKMKWDSPKDARQFVEGYTTLLTYYGAKPVSGHRNTYRIPEGEEFADAFYVEQNGDTVFIVNGPTVEDLADIRAGAAPSASATSTTTETDTRTDTRTATGTGTEGDGSGPDEDDTGAETTDGGNGGTTGTDTGSGSGGQPGFGLGVAVVALLAVLVVLRRRR